MATFNRQITDFRCFWRSGTQIRGKDAVAAGLIPFGIRFRAQTRRSAAPCREAEYLERIGSMTSETKRST